MRIRMAGTYSIYKFVHEHHITVFAYYSGPAGKILVRFLDFCITGTTSAYGKGDTIDEAIDDYAKRISGETIVHVKTGKRIIVGDLI